MSQRKCSPTERRQTLIWVSGSHIAGVPVGFITGTGPVPGAAAKSGIPSLPSSVIDWSRTRKNLQAYRGEQSQSSREISCDDAMNRSAAISALSSHPISSTVQQSRRTHLIRTSVRMPGFMMVKSQILPGSRR